MIIKIGDYILKPTFGMGNISKYGGEYTVYDLKLLAGYYEIIKINNNHIKAKFIGKGRDIVKNKDCVLFFEDLKTANPDVKIEFIK
ncbi:MAG: hypothetical protein ACI4A5_03290 [Hominilimicola sp.]